MEGRHYTLQSSQAKMTEHEVVLLKKGGTHITPKKYPTFYYHETDSDSCTYKETFIVVKLKAFI